MYIDPKILDFIIIALSIVILVFFLLILYFHFKNSRDENFMKIMHGRLLSFVNERRGALMPIMDIEDKTISSIKEIRGIRSTNGLRLFTEIASGLDDSDLWILQTEFESSFFQQYVNKVLSRNKKSELLILFKTISSLKLVNYKMIIYRKLILFPESKDIQYACLLSLSLLGAKDEIIDFYYRKDARVLLSFRALNEIINHYAGDKEDLFKTLIFTARDPYVVSICIKCITNDKLYNLIVFIRQFLKSPVHNIKIESIRCLGLLKDKESEDAIVRLLDDGRWEVRVAAVAAIRSYGPLKHVDRLVYALCDYEWWVRYRAAEALCDLGNAQFILNKVKDTGDAFAFDMMSYMINKRCLSGNVNYDTI